MTRGPLLLLALTLAAGCGPLSEQGGPADAPATSTPASPAQDPIGPCNPATQQVPSAGASMPDSGGAASTRQGLQATAPAPVEGLREARMLVRLRPGARLDAARLEELGARVERELPAVDSVAVSATPQALEALSADGAVAGLEEDRMLYALGPSLVGSPGEYPRGIQQVQAPAVWDANLDGLLDAGAPTGEPIRVCVIDSGIDPRHPELRRALRGGWDFVDGDAEPYDEKDGVWGTGHGTHVAGIIAAQLGEAGVADARTDPGGVVGVAPGVALYVARVLDIEGKGRTSLTIAALHWCQEQGARVVSISLGAPEPNDTEREAMAQATRAGMLVVAAAGNEGNAKPLSWPAAYPGVLSVGAVDAQLSLASFSETGESLSLVAPGVGVLSTSIVGAGREARLDADGMSLAASPLMGSGTGLRDDMLVDCGLGDSTHSCQSGATCAGFVALVDRGGGITFANKVRNLRAQGAKAVIVADNAATDGGSFELGNGEWPATVAVSRSTGAWLRAHSLAPGARVRVEVYGTDYAYMSGTSMATPHVSGVAALVWSAAPQLTATQVRSVLEETALDLETPGHDARTGYGLVQAKEAVARARALVGGQ